MAIRKKILAVLILLGLVGALAAPEVKAQSIADDSEVAAQYARGKRLLREEAYLEASKVFEQLGGLYPNSPDLYLFVFHRAKADYYFGSYNEAIAGFSYYLAQFASSPETAHAHYYLGNAYYSKSDLTRALRHYFSAYDLSTDVRLTALAESAITSLIKSASTVGLTKSDFDNIDPEHRCDLIRVVVTAMIEKEMLLPARKIAEICPKNSDLVGQLGQPVGTASGSIEIALVLPFSGEMQSYAEEINNGAIIAADQIRLETGLELKLDKYDTKGDPVDAARIIRQLSDSYINLAIGPLTSEESQVAAAALSCSDLPLIIPAATQAGLTDLSASAFQLSPNIELQGIMMADYALSQLKADSAAIITSTRPDHLRMARAFAQRFQARGGVIMSTQYYRSRDKDFGPIIRDTKADLIGSEPDSTFYINQRGDTLDFDGIVVNVDCFYMPGEASQLRLLLAQMNFYHLKGAYLGADGWGDDKVFRLGDDITRNAVFPSPFLMAGRGPEYLKFSALFDTRFARQPQRLANLGYDAVRLAMNAIISGGGERQQIISALRKVKKHEGVAGVVTFGQYRENSEMPVFRIVNGEAVPIAGKTVGDGDE